MQSCKLYYGFAIIALILVGLCAGDRQERRRDHDEDNEERVDIANRVAWLPAGTEIVLRFLINVSDAMIAQYTLALERIRAIRATWNSYPNGYRSIDLFYDNDIQHASYSHHAKPGGYKPGHGDHAFRAAFETIQNFANKRVPPYEIN